MKVLITGICGFAGNALANQLLCTVTDLELYGIDNFMRAGSELNREPLLKKGVTLFHGDLRNASDFENIPAVDWVIDAAANPSVLAGVDGRTGSRQLVEHNLFGSVNLLEFCKRVGAGLILLSTSRVYSISGLTGLELQLKDRAYSLVEDQIFPSGVSLAGLSEAYATQAPVSLYGATKLASEALALEYGLAYDFPVWINRCGVLAGAGQFGRADQGIFSYWIHAWQQRHPLKYIGFDGAGHQVRDCLHPDDLSRLIMAQMQAGREPGKPAIINVAGGSANACSLRQLSDWCSQRFGVHPVASEARQRPFDLPWVVLDSGLARKHWDWTPERSTESILEEIAQHAEAHPEWLQLTGA